MTNRDTTRTIPLSLSANSFEPLILLMESYLLLLDQYARFLGVT